MRVTTFRSFEKKKGGIVDFEKTNNINYNIQTFRTIAAIFVIIIHITAYMEKDNATFLNYFFYRRNLDFGVNYFFTITGFFLASHSNHTKVLNGIKKNINLYLFASFTVISLNVLLVTIKRLLLDESIKTGLRQIFNRITVSNFIKGTFASIHLWYLSSLIIILVLYYLFFKNNISKFNIIAISFVIFIFSYFDIFEMNQYIEQSQFSALHRPVFWVGLGYFSSFINVKFKHSIKLFLLSFLSISFLSYFNVNNFDFFIHAFSIFMLLNYLKYNKGKENILSKLGDKTLYVYIYHMFFRNLIRVGFSYFCIDKSQYLLLEIALNIVISFAFCPILYKVFKKTSNKIVEVIFAKVSNA